MNKWIRAALCAAIAVFAAQLRSHGRAASPSPTSPTTRRGARTNRNPPSNFLQHYYTFRLDGTGDLQRIVPRSGTVDGTVNYWCDTDRDTAVPMTTYRARLAFGSVPAGAYVLHASVGGLASKFSFVVGSGVEPGLRDHDLRLKARRTNDYAEFRALQLERVERNPKQLDALYDLIARALVHAPLEETSGYVDRAIASATSPAGVQQLRNVKASLPEHYANRMATERDPRTESSRSGRNSEVLHL